MASKGKRRSTGRTSARAPSGRTEANGRWQRAKWWFVGGGLAAGLALLVALTFAIGGPERPEITGQELGSAKAAPDMTLATLDGNFRLSENRGEVLLLYFSFPG